LKGERIHSEGGTTVIKGEDEGSEGGSPVRFVRIRKDRRRGSNPKKREPWLGRGEENQWPEM